MSTYIVKNAQTREHLSTGTKNLSIALSQAERILDTFEDLKAIFIEDENGNLIYYLGEKQLN